MNLAGLPINIQRRIALLIDEKTDTQATPSAPLSKPDRPVVDQAAAATPYGSRPEAGNNDDVQPWNFPVHALVSQLHQQPAVVVKTAALGPSKLQARYDCSHKHAEQLLCYMFTQEYKVPFVYRLADHRLSMCYNMQTPLVWEGACTCKLIKICRYMHVSQCAVRFVAWHSLKYESMWYKLAHDRQT